MSTIDFHRLPKANLQGLHFGVISADADYGPAVRRLIADKIGKELITTKNRAPPIVRRR